MSDAEPKPWEVWAFNQRHENTLVRRARGELPEMESTKQLVKLVADVYQPGMRVLDVGCNAGHYLVGLRRIARDLDYTGVDAYEGCISEAKAIFAGDKHARFEVKSVLHPIFPDAPRDIVYCCNVLLHLPEFKVPVRNLLQSATRACFIRTLFGERTTIVRRAAEEGMDIEPDGTPLRYIHQNTYDRVVFRRYVESLGWKVEFVEDEFDASVLDREHTALKKGQGTRILGGKQVDGNIIFNWEWARITR